jgi:uncharacterized protein (TIGR03083 family)
MRRTPAKDAELQELITAERRDIAQVLGSLPAGSWETPSLCAGWRVREVVAHMTMPFRYSTPRFAAEIARDRGKFNRMADRCARRDAAMAADALVAALRDNAAKPWKPPGGGLAGALVHDVIHGLDMTVPLGSGRQVPEDRLRLVLDAITRPGTLSYFGADLSQAEFRADDIDWSFGSGEPVSGAAQDLALVLCGRKLPAGRLRGALSGRYASALP